MTAVRPQPLDANPPVDEAEDVDDELNAEGTDAMEDDDTDDEAPELVAEESGIDLTDASELDADNVPADEEHDRVVHAPD